MCCDRNPLQCILPPHMARKLAENRDPAVRARAIQSLAASSRLRGRRDIFSLITLPSRLADDAALHRTIYTAGNGTQLPGERVRDEGNPPAGDPAVDEAYDGLGATYKLYSDAFSRNSLDDKGLPLIASVHYDQQYDNAMWDGQQMLFGDGDGQFFNRFTIAIDVIGHELTHGVTQFTSALEYHDQPGALNESFSDVFGSLVKQYNAGQTADEADWLIGAGLLTNNVKGRALRDMLNPGTAYNDPDTIGKDPQPNNMRSYDPTRSDHGGVHINSGIPNRAFALTAKAIGGNAWDDAGKIWYKTLLQLQPTSQFQDAADMTYAVAGTEFGSNSTQQQAVVDAWSQVGIKVTGVSSTRRARAIARAAAETEGNGLAGQMEKIAAEVRRLSELVNTLRGGDREGREYGKETASKR